MSRDNRKHSIKNQYPKGSPAPSGYVYWHEWAEAQHLHGLRQKQCVTCGRYKFPQELNALGGCADYLDCYEAVKKWGKLPPARRRAAVTQEVKHGE